MSKAKHARAIKTKTSLTVHAQLAKGILDNTKTGNIENKTTHCHKCQKAAGYRMNRKCKDKYLTG
jgi:hypothetical protein